MDGNESISDERAILDRKFWLIILTSWGMDEIVKLEDWAEICEKSVSW